MKFTLSSRALSVRPASSAWVLPLAESGTFQSMSCTYGES